MEKDEIARDTIRQGQYVRFTPEEIKAWREATNSIDIAEFVQPQWNGYIRKVYYLAQDKGAIAPTVYCANLEGHWRAALGQRPREENRTWFDSPLEGPCHGASIMRQSFACLRVPHPESRSKRQSWP